MRSLRDAVRGLRALIGSRGRWRWVVLLVGALLVTLLEAVGAGLVFVLVGMVSGPETSVELPLVGDLATLFPALDAVQLRVLVAASVAAFFVFRSTVYVGNAYVQYRLLHNAGAVLATDLLRGYLAMPYLQHTQRSSAELVRNTYDATQQVVNQVMRPVVVLVTRGMLVVGLLVVLLVGDPRSTLLAIAVLGPAVLLLQMVVQPRLKRLGRRAQQARTGSIAAVQQSLGAIRDIKLLDSGPDFAATHAGERIRLARSQYLAKTIKALPKVLIETSLVLVIVVIFVGALLTGQGVEQVLATLGLFAYVGLRLQPALQEVVKASNELRFGTAVLDDLVAERSMIDAWIGEERAARSDNTAEVAPFSDELRLEEVSFAYVPGGRPALRDIDLTIRAGEFIGIVGPTGGGKSTLVDLLVGLLEPTSGRIEVDARPLGSRPFWWWQQLGVVSQQVFLLDGSLRANIAFGEHDTEVDEERLARCVRRAQLQETVDGLPEGLDTQVGERGVRLSGGQRQRVAIARALYREPSVLVLDEGTSALDGATEAALVSALDEVSEGRTLIAVAHRLSTVRDADRILVVADGTIVDQGSFAELARTSERFRGLANLDGSPPREWSGSEPDGR